MVFKVLVVFILISGVQYHHGIAGHIVYPWRATSSIVERGTSFYVLYNNLKSLPIDSVILKGPFNQVALGIDSINIGKFEFDHYTEMSVNNRIWVNVPQTAPEELYDLIIYSGGQTHKSPKSVHVVDAFRPSHTFIHITDLHMTRQWVGTAEEGYAKELELFDGFVEVANIIAPDFILITGDNIMEYTMFDADSTGWNGVRVYEGDQRPLVEEKYKNLFYGSHGFSGIYGLNSPSFLIAGNHDFHGIPIRGYHLEKATQWNNMMGKRVHGFAYADTRVILSDDSLGETEYEIPASAPMSGIQGKVHEEWLEEQGAGSIRVFAQHKHNPIDTMFMDRNNINILLNGHSHSPYHEYIGSTPTLNSRPGVICRSGEINNWEQNLGFFRIFYIDGDTFEYTQPLRFCTNPTDHYENFDLNLTLHFQKPNDGSSSTNEATITNSFDVDLPGCKIRFVMQKGQYEVSGGMIQQVIETADKTVVDVYADVNSNDHQVVHIYSIE